MNPAFAGAFTLVGDTYTENNTDVLLVANQGSDEPALGERARSAATAATATSTKARWSVNGITVPGIYNVANAGLAPVNGQTITNQAVNTTYGSASFTWDSWWTVEGTARNDWSSTLPQGANSYFYPSVNTSIVLSDAIPSLRVGPISYLKLRGGTARAGNDAAPYSLFTTYNGSASKFDGQPLFSLGNSLLNPDLKPETTTSNEGGLELGLWGSRMSLDASVYDKYTTDEITNVADPIEHGLFEQARQRRKDRQPRVRSARHRRADPQQQVGLEHRPSTSRTTRVRSFRSTRACRTSRSAASRAPCRWRRASASRSATSAATRIKRDPTTGLPLLADDGTYQPTDTMVNFGSIQPDWTGGWVNTIRYKRVHAGEHARRPARRRALQRHELLRSGDRHAREHDVRARRWTGTTRAS